MLEFKNISGAGGPGFGFSWFIAKVYYSRLNFSEKKLFLETSQDLIIWVKRLPMSDEKKIVRPFEFLSLSKKIKSYTYTIQQQNRLVLKINESGIGFRKEFTENNMILRQASIENLTGTLDQVISLLP
jgi:hypothetical protein